MTNRAFKQIRKTLFSIAVEEASFGKRGFSSGKDQAVREFLEACAQTFVLGYNTAIETDQLTALMQTLEQVEASRRGFAYEGAAMGLSLLDYFAPRQQRLRSFMQTLGNDHLYMLHVGAGWTLGRLPRSYRRLLAAFDPVLQWLAIDGYGFHEGFFHWPRTLTPPFRRPQRLSAYALRAFDQGLGRSLWFVKSAQTQPIIETINAFPTDRQADLWSGISLASTYAGGVPVDTVVQLFTASNHYQPYFAQGIAFATKARYRAHNMTPHAEKVCSTIWGCSSEQLSQIVDDSLQKLPPNDQAYEAWREGIRSQFPTPSGTHGSLNKSESSQTQRTTL